MSRASGGLTICRTQANGARLPAPTPAMAGEVNRLKSNRIEISVINLTTFHRITRLQLLAPNPN